MLRSGLELASFVSHKTIFNYCQRTVKTLSPSEITSLLRKNEIKLPNNVLPKCVKTLECNQLESNNPIEDRLKVSRLQLPGCNEPTLILGVFDGHGNGTTVDIISQRLFNYIALSIHPEPGKLKISNHVDLRNLLTDLHFSPLPKELNHLQVAELKALSNYRDELSSLSSSSYSPEKISANIKASFNRCDDDLSQEIQDNLINSRAKHQSILHHYLTAAVSGCCALVMVIHDGLGYVASTGDCRAVLGEFERSVKSGIEQPKKAKTNARPYYNFTATELNDEHNCDNIHEIRRLTASHPRSEQNTMIRNNRLLGNLMPFRAFGDFTYKWSPELIEACGLVRIFGSSVIPQNYNSPPYLISEPDVRVIEMNKEPEAGAEKERLLVIATDGLWEMFESSREVIESIVDHSMNASQQPEDYDENRATHILRTALRSGSQQDYGMDSEELKKFHHLRLVSTLSLPRKLARSYRDDISILVINL